MHQVILDRLEEHLSGSPIPREFKAHLESCEECRTEVHDMQELSGALGSLRISEPIPPPPGFYARVSQRLEDQRPARSGACSGWTRRSASASHLRP